LVEHSPEKAGVVSSILTLTTREVFCHGVHTADARREGKAITKIFHFLLDFHPKNFYFWVANILCQNVF